jgi:hypothetical protein
VLLVELPLRLFDIGQAIDGPAVTRCERRYRDARFDGGLSSPAGQNLTDAVS